jgi:RNA polymerase sigma-70 factor (ECF subfamily)
MEHSEFPSRGPLTTKAQMTDGTAPPDDLGVLAERAAGGDKNAMDDLLRLVHPRVLRICRSVLPYSADAEDAAQEALLNIATKIHTYSGRSSFSTWVHSVAANSARSTYRKLPRTTPTNWTSRIPGQPV